MHRTVTASPFDSRTVSDTLPSAARRAAWRHVLASAWTAWRQAWRARQDMRVLLELSPRALDDMGAPDWLRHEAARHQAGQALRRHIDGQCMR